MRLTVRTSTTKAVRSGEIVTVTSKTDQEMKNPSQLEIKGSKVVVLQDPTFVFGEGYKNSKPSGIITVHGWEKTGMKNQAVTIVLD